MKIPERLRVKPMTPERIEQMYPPVGRCEICRKPAIGSMKVVFRDGGWRDFILNLLNRRRYTCAEHLDAVFERTWMAAGGHPDEPREDAR